MLQHFLNHPPRPESVNKNAAFGNELHFRHLLESLPAGAYTCDSEGLITYYNRHAVQLWGRAPSLNDPNDRFCGSFKLYQTDGTPISHDRCWMALALQDDCEYNGREIVIEQPNGQRIVALAHANPIHNEWNQLVGAVNVLVDISAQKQAEESRRKLELQLQQAQKLESLGIVAGGIAHDFNNLLTAMMGYANLAAMELPAESVAYTMLQEIESAAQRAADLARQMLAYSGHGAFVMAPLQLDQQVREIAHLLETVISKKAQLQFDLAPVYIEGDTSQICQVVMNLITNASEALEGRNGTITLRTSVSYADEELLHSSLFPEALKPGDYALIEVVDDGCGIAPENLERIFEPFFSTRFTGRGLGLSAVLGIVRGHGGTIKVQSTPGQGTRFQIWLPHIAPPPDQPVVASLNEPQSQPQLATRTVLLVDDEPGVRSLAMRVLTRAGFRVLEAADGEKGLALFRDHQAEIDAVLLDLTMPRMSGGEVLGELRQLRADLPVLLMSGYTELDVTAQTRSAGGVNFLQKPFLAQQLITQVRQMLPVT
jgi:signal transduction histidine kinase